MPPRVTRLRRLLCGKALPFRQRLISFWRLRLRIKLPRGSGILSLRCIHKGQIKMKSCFSLSSKPTLAPLILIIASFQPPRRTGTNGVDHHAMD